MKEMSGLVPGCSSICIVSLCLLLSSHFAPTASKHKICTVHTYVNIVYNITATSFIWPLNPFSARGTLGTYGCVRRFKLYSFIRRKTVDREFFLNKSELRADNATDLLLSFFADSPERSSTSVERLD